MRKMYLSKVGLAAIVFLLFLFACKKETKTPITSSVNENSSIIAAKGSPKSTSTIADYNIALAVSADGQVWTYTITRANTKAKNLSHIILDLNNCADESATFADIISATLNGAPADLKPTEGSGTDCNPQAVTENFVKISFTAATQWVLVITYDRGYEISATANGWVKAGTSCNAGSIPAPGCPKDAYCSFSQGYFFAGGTENNGASAFWVNGLTIGGIAYTQTQGTDFWSIDKGKGGDQTMNAFFQLGAVRLSGAENEVAADAKIIDDYFTGLDVASKITTGTNTNGPAYQYFNLPATNISNSVSKQDAIDAGTRIAAYIDANHCQ